MGAPGAPGGFAAADADEPAGSADEAAGRGGAAAGTAGARAGDGIVVIAGETALQPGFDPGVLV